MIKGIILGSIATAAAVATPVVVAASATQDNNKNESASKGHTIFYDNSFFNSKEQLLRYYLNKHPNAISNKMVLGDIGHSVIDYDDGILNQNTLYDYDIDKINPVYYKSGGQTTSSYDDALNSYANRVFIRTKYQGVQNIFSNIEDARDERKRLISNLYLDYYNAPRPVSSGDLKINPLNEGDTSAFKGLFKNAIINDKKLNDSYSRIFDFPDFSKESLLEDHPKLKELEKFDAHGKNDLGTVKFGIKEEGTSKDEGSYLINFDGYKNREVPEHILSDMKLNFFGLSSDPDNEYSFYTKEVDNGLRSGHEKNEPKVGTLPKSKDIQNLNSKKDIDPITTKESKSQFAKISSGSYWWQMDLKKSSAWNDFIKEVNKKQEAITKNYGSNYEMSLDMSYNTDFSKGQKFSPVICDYYDDPSTSDVDSDTMSIRSLNLKYFDIKVEFTLKRNNTSLTSNFSQWLSGLVNKGHDTNYSYDSLYDLFEKYIETERKKISKDAKMIEIDKDSEKNIIDSLSTDDKLKIKLESIPENILMMSKTSGKPEKIFKIIRDPNDKDNINLKYNHDQMYKSDATPDKTLTKEEFLKRTVNSLKGVQGLDSSSITKILNFITKPYDVKSIDEDLVKALNLLKSKSFDIDLIPLDEDSNSISNFGEIIKTHLKSLNIYLNKNKNSLNTIADYAKSTFIKRSCINLDESFFLPSSFIGLKKGTYVLVNELMFNSGVSTETSTDIGPDNIYSGSSAVTDINNHRDAIIKTDPPRVKVMYNINGEAIIGDISGNQLPVYDSEELLVAEAQCQASVRKSSDYIYYKTENGIEKEILNTQSNIYVLSIIGHNPRYFIDYTHLKKYLLNWLISNALLIE